MNIVEVNSCADCPFCNYDNEYGRDGCKANEEIVLNGDGGFEQLPDDGVHEECPLKEDVITVSLKI